MRTAAAIFVSLLFCSQAHAHYYYLARSVTIEARDDGTVGALIVFDVPRGTTAALIRAGLDDDWNRKLSPRERTRGLAAWAEVGMRDIAFFVDGMPAECTSEVSSTLQETLPDDTPFAVAVLYECHALLPRAGALWRLWIGTKVKSTVRVLRKTMDTVLAGDISEQEEKRFREIVLLTRRVD